MYLLVSVSRKNVLSQIIFPIRYSGVISRKNYTMKNCCRTTTALLLIGLCAGIRAQNLITNPGFENDSTGWANFWSRTAGAGSLTIVTSPVHSGAKAARIRHWGLQDWSVETQT